MGTVVLTHEFFAEEFNLAFDFAFCSFSSRDIKSDFESNLVM
jgi:hypothetical protein